MTATDFDEIDFFRARPLYQDPYPYYEYLRDARPGVARAASRCRHGHRVRRSDGGLQRPRDVLVLQHGRAGRSPSSRFRSRATTSATIIEEHRDELPFSDQLPSFDPPKHTAHRGLLMRLITPKRLKENEEFMWRLADRQIDEFLDRGECEFVHDYANPFTLLVIADLLGVPEADHETVPRGAAGRAPPDPTRRARRDGAQAAGVPLRAVHGATSRTVAASRATTS